MRPLNLEEILDRVQKGPRIHVFPVQSWGGESVCVRELDGLQILEWDQASVDRSKDQKHVFDRGTGAEHLVRLSLVHCELDDNGIPIQSTAKRVFGDSHKDIMAVRQLGGALNELASFCLRCNRLLKEDVDDAIKNLSKPLGSDSGSTSPTDGAAQ